MVHRRKNNRVARTSDWRVLLPNLWSIAAQITAETGNDVEAWAQRFHAGVRPAVRIILSAFGKTSKPDLLYSILGNLISNGLIENRFILSAGANVAKHYHDRLRDIHTFRNTSRTPPRKAFSLLLRHLFAEYDVPQFLDSVWLESGSRYQEVFKHLASGKSLKTAPLGLDVTLTKKIAHHFGLAPSHYTIPEALRWGQIHAIGGGKGKHLVEAIRGTRLAHTFIDDAFWFSFLRFLINSDSLESVNQQQIHLLIEYIWDRRFVPQRILIAGGGERLVSPPQSQFRLKGKCLKNLIADAEDWHDAPWDDRVVGFQWHEKIAPFEVADEGEHGPKTVYSFRQHLSSSELVKEGKLMGHCVGDEEYAKACYAGQIAIVSLGRYSGTGIENLLTIQVDLQDEKISEIRGEDNRPPTPQELRIVKYWASANHLKMTRWDPSTNRREYRRRRDRHVLQVA